MRRSADDVDFEVQAAVVRGGNPVGEPGGQREVGPRQSLREDPARAGAATDFLVVREVQLDRACEARASDLDRGP
jgi:hypothetical protein